MSQQLPPHPNLEHLRNQAKALLAARRLTDPEMKLADALHLVARDYGFPSWPKLKAHVAEVRSATAAPSEPEPRSPFVGRWVADVGQSVRHPANQFERAVLDIQVTGNAVRIAHGYVDESGRREHGVSEFDVDGTDHVTGNGYVLTASWSGPRAFETIARKDGEIAGHGRYEVSPDGRSMTITGPEQRLVLVRS